MSDKYCYPGTDVLINKFGITDDLLLQTIERQITSVRQAEILKSKYYELNFEYFKSIHKKMFGDIYEWAGIPRTVTIQKGNSIFCLPEYIEKNSKIIFSGIKKENFLNGLTKYNFVDRLAYYVSEINALHPFREGNGRTQRTFFIKLSNSAGFDIFFDKVDRGLLIYADVMAMNGNDNFLKEILYEIVDKIN